MVTMLQGRPGSVARSRYEAVLSGLRRPPADTFPWRSEAVHGLQIRGSMVETHEFLHRCVRYLSGQAIRRYLAFGAGEPCHRIFREVLYRVDPWADVAVLQTDAMMLAVRHSLHCAGQARGLPFVDTPPPRDQLIGSWRGRFDPGLNVDRDGVDLAEPQPVGVFLAGVLHHVVDERRPGDIISDLTGMLPPGSFVVMSHLTGDFPSAGLRAAVRAYERTGVPIQLRSRSEVLRLLTGLDLVDPGVDLISNWRRDPTDAAAAPAGEVACWGAVGRVPGLSVRP